MKRTIALVATAAVLALTLPSFAAAAGGKSSAWNASHLPSPAPGYLPKTSPQPLIQIVRVVESRPSSGFRLRDAAIGAAFTALAVAALGGGALLATRGRGIAPEG